MQRFAKWFAAALYCLSFAATASQAPMPTATHGSGPDFIGYYNAAHAATSTLQAGTSDPTTNGGAYSWWADTTNSLLKQRNSSNTGWNTIAPLGAQLLPLSGGTLTGPLTVPTSLEVSGAAASTRTVQLSTSGAARWKIYANTASESGSNAGSNLQICGINDAGSASINCASVTRSTGAWTFPTTPTFTTPAASDDSTKGATTAFVIDREQSHCAFDAYATSTQSSNILGVVSFGSIGFTKGSCFSSSVFTAAENGIYQFNFSVQLYNNSGATATNAVFLYAAGVPVAFGQPAPFANGSAVVVNGSATVKLAAGQVVVVQMNSAPSAQWQISSALGLTRFSGTFISAY